MMWVKDVMTPIPFSLTESHSCEEALGLISRHRAPGWPVLDADGELAGIVAMDLLAGYLSGDGCRDGTLSCMKAIDPDPIILKATLALDAAWSQRFNVAAVSREDGEIIGVLSRADLAVALYQRAEFQIKELEAVLNSAHNGIVVINSEGLITSFNRAAEKFTRLPRDKAIGRHVLDVLVPLGLMETLQTGQAEYSQKFRVGRGTYIMNRDPVIQDGRISGAVGVFQDISEIESVSQELVSVKELNRELDSVIQSSSDGFVVTDASGQILRVNSAYEKLSQSTLQELYGRRIQELGEEGIYAHSLVDVVLQRRHPVTVVESKQDHSFMVTGSPVFDEEGRLLRVVINLRDMTMLNQLRQELVESKRLSEKYHSELAELRDRQDTGGMIVSGPEMERVLELIMRVATVDSTVLLLGESGVGKEGMAKLLYTKSLRSKGPFIKVNCGAIPEHLLESELFGYEGGAFTGARREGKIGMFELAHNGTLLLDEIGDLPLNLQAKLLRVLQEREIVPVGGSKPREVNVRILAATHKDLEDMVRSGNFREDLFFRLNVVPILIPPLRERRSDIVPLLHHFREKFSKKYELHREFSPEVVEAFVQYDWPGNVRELENMVERLMVMAPSELITLPQLPPVFQRHANEDGGVSVHSLMPLKEAVMEVERQLIEKALKKYGSTYKAAEALGVNQSTVVRRMARFRKGKSE
ncbi:MAG: sigma 54-interacting transcriptional regulator [Desulfitobacteriaceae bacterium]